MVGAYLYLRIIRPPKDGGAEAAPPSATRKEALGGQGSALGRGIGALWGSRSSAVEKWAHSQSLWTPQEMESILLHKVPKKIIFAIKCTLTNRT